MSGPTQLYIDYLVQEGFRPSTDSDGDVTFKAEGKYYYIDIDASDAGYFRLVFPNFWPIERDEELVKAVLAANYATMMTKVAKVYVRRDGKNVVASIELFLGRPEYFRDVFQRAMRALNTSVEHFREKMI